MEKKLIVTIFFFIFGLANCFSQTNLGQISFGYRPSWGEIYNIEISINPWIDRKELAVVEIEINRKNKTSIEIPIDKYYKLCEVILKIDLAKLRDFERASFCADGTGVDIGFGISDKVYFSTNCLSRKYPVYNAIFEAVKIISDFSGIDLYLD